MESGTRKGTTLLANNSLDMPILLLFSASFSIPKGRNDKMRFFYLNSLKTRLTNAGHNDSRFPGWNLHD